MRCLNLNVLAKLCDSVIWASSVLSQSAPWKFSENGFTPSLVSVLQCSLATFLKYLLSVGAKPIVAFSPFSKELSSVYRQTFLCKQEMSGSKTAVGALHFWIRPSWVISYARKEAL